MCVRKNSETPFWQKISLVHLLSNRKFEPSIGSMEGSKTRGVCSAILTFTPCVVISPKYHGQDASQCLAQESLVSGGAMNRGNPASCHRELQTAEMAGGPSCLYWMIGWRHTWSLKLWRRLSTSGDGKGYGASYVEVSTKHGFVGIHARDWVIILVTA